MLTMLRTSLRLSVLLVLGGVVACSNDTKTTPSPSTINAPSAAPTDAGGAKKPRIAIITNNPEEFWTIAERGAEKAAKDFNCVVSFRKPDKGEVAIQMDIVNALVKQGYDGIAVSVINPIEQAPDLKQLAKKTKLITMDNDAAGSDRICYVGTDNYEAGKAAGKLVKHALPTGGKIAIFVGQMSALNAQQRFQGVVDELAGMKNAKGPKYGNYELHRGEAITDGPNREVAQQNAAQVLEKIGNEANVCMVGLWAYNAPAILEAAKAKGLKGKVKIVSFDEMNETLLGIDEGSIVGTVVQDPFNFAYMSVDILVNEVQGKTDKRTKSAVPHRVVTKDGKAPAGETGKALTVQQFKDDFDMKLGKKK
jgi:ribose transport system substrate-binding protein